MDSRFRGNDKFRNSYINMLKNQIILITGATSGFGHAMALRFAKEGTRIIATGRRTQRLKELKKVLGDKVHTLTFDVSKQAQVEKALGSLPKEWQNIDVLVNNAGGALGAERMPKASLADWEQMVDTNIKGLLYCTHLIVPGMIKRGRGYIVNIGSVAGSYAYPGGNAYGASKAFVKQFSQNLRSDLLGKNIRVTNIEPGMAQTEFSVVRCHGSQDKADAVYKGTQPLTAEDIAESVLFCLRQSPHVNITRLEIMPTRQALAGFAVDRDA